MRLAMRLGLPYKRRRTLWTPAELASLGAYWWDAAKGVTLRESGGTDYVTTWADRLQGGVELAQSTTSDQPTYETVGGLPAICTPGNTTQSLHGLFGETLTEFTILAAYASADQYSAAARSYLWDGQNASKRAPLFMRYSAWESFFDDGGGNANRQYTGIAVSPPLLSGGTLVNRVYGSSATPILHVNGGVGVATADTPTAGEMILDGITIGPGYESGKVSSNSTQQQIREIVIVPGDVGVDTINQWLAYCQRRYGLAYTEAS